MVVLFFSVMNARAQNDTCTGSLSGKIIDEHDQTPLDFATIYIVEPDRSSISDEQGNYRIEKLCEGTYTIKISHLGCEPLEEKIVITGHTEKNFYPEHHTEELRGIEVIAEKPVENPVQPLDTVSHKNLEESKGRSLGDALKSVTGVTALQTGASIVKPVIHGLHSSRILILNNGIRQEGQQWGNEHAPEIDPFVAGNLSVVKGAAGVRYGSDAMAGVILVNPRPLRDSAGIGGEFNLVGLSNGQQGTASGMAEGNFRKKLSPFSWRIQGTYKRGGTIQAPDYYLKNTGMKEYNFSYVLQWKKDSYGADVFYSQFNTALGIFSAAHIGNLTDLYKAFSSPVPLETSGFSYEIGRPYQHIEHELFKGNFYIKTGNAGKLEFTYGRQYNLRYEFDKHRPLNDSIAALNKPELQFEITTQTGDINWEHNKIKSWSGQAGISFLTQGNTYEGRFFIPNFRNYSGGVFWIEKFKKEKYELEFGARYDYKWLQIFKYEKNGPDYTLISPIREFRNASGTFGLIYKPGPAWNVIFNSGTAWRAPGVNELYSDGLHHGAASIENGDTALVPEKAFNNIVSVKYHPGTRLMAEVSGYYNYINDFIYLEPSLVPTLTIRGAFPTFYYKQTNAGFKGMDAMFVYKPLSFLEVSAKTSLLRAWNLSEEQWLINMPADRCEMELTYTAKNTKYFSDAYLSPGGLFVSRQWRVPANSDYVSPPGEYFLFNLESGFTLHLKKQPVVVGFGIRNILNRSYRDYLDRFRYYTDAMGRNFSLRIKVPFNISFKHQTTKAVN